MEPLTRGCHLGLDWGGRSDSITGSGGCLRSSGCLRGSGGNGVNTHDLHTHVVAIPERLATFAYSGVPRVELREAYSAVACNCGALVVLNDQVEFIAVAHHAILDRGWSGNTVCWLCCCGGSLGCGGCGADA